MVDVVAQEPDLHGPRGTELRLLLDSASASDPALPAVPSGLAVDVAQVRTAPAVAAASDGARGLSDVLAMTRAARRAAYDVVFFPASYSWFPVLGAPVVLTVHDAIAETLPELTLPSRAARLRWNLKQRLALRQAHTVLTVSEASRAAVREHLGVDDGRLQVVHEAPDDHFRPVAEADRTPALARHGVAPGTRYLLYVGGISPHKNLLMLVEAFARLADPDLHLLLVGATDDDPFMSSTGSVRAAVAASSASERVRLLGYVADEDLPALYAAALATVQPSLGEGFGLTAAESVACGTPVVASRDAALVELLGPAGTFADAFSVEEWTSTLAGLAADPGRLAALSAAGLERAAGWSWDQGARRTLAALAEAAGRG